MTRIITSIIGIPILIYLIQFAPITVFIAVVFIAAILCLYEYFIMTEIVKKPWMSVAGFSLATLIFLSFCFPDAVLLHYLMIAPMLILVAALFSRVSFSYGLRLTSGTLFGAFYTAGLLGYLVSLRLIDSAGDLGADLVMMVFVIIWAGDTSAYFVGRKYGKHPLSVVSPKKTIEGAIAGLLFSILMAGVCKFLFARELPLLHTFILGGVVGLLGQIGDLCESLLKRSANVKDSGTILPGHGGMLDRLDSLLFGAPAMYYYYYFVLRP